MFIRTVLLIIFLASVGLWGAFVAPWPNVGGGDAKEYADEGFSYRQLDPKGPRAAWGKAVGDINGDGLVDIIVGGHKRSHLNFWQRSLTEPFKGASASPKGELVWYQNPSWEKHTISERYAIRTDLAAADINHDGDMDLAVLTDSGLVLFWGPRWETTLIDNELLHDLELADLDLDGRIEIVARSQSLFGYDNGDAVYIYQQNSFQDWEKRIVPVPHGEGLALADMNADGYEDIVVNRIWLENPGDSSSEVLWRSWPYSVDWDWDDVYIDTGDFNGDGREDIVLSPAESAGQFYKISWFEAPTDAGLWKQHVIDMNVEAVHHFVAAADVNNDGSVDVLTAEMNQGAPPNEVKSYLNQGAGRTWKKQVLGDSASHSMQLLDVDGDFDIDLMGAHWQKKNFEEDYPVELWINAASKDLAWRRLVIDSDRPGQAIFVIPKDIDNDGYSDIVTGAFWYKNPGSEKKEWQRNPIGTGANNVALVEDFDDDGLLDVLASPWREYPRSSRFFRAIKNLGTGSERVFAEPFVWAKNLGGGQFELFKNIANPQGDFLQGAALVHSSIARPTGGNKSVFLSWHREDEGIQSFLIPENPTQDMWDWRMVSLHSQDEALSVGDVNRDGNIDVVLGTQWLASSGEGRWHHRVLHSNEGLPDRNKLVDMNADGRVDVVIGYQAVNKLGKIAWYEQGETAEDLWIEHIIADVVGPMSLDVADMDDDGDFDVVVGEHNLNQPDQARLIQFENVDGRGREWRGHLLYKGDEHHNGAQTVDIDNDGDLDIVSIGWGHQKVLLYRNPRISTP